MPEKPHSRRNASPALEQRARPAKPGLLTALSALMLGLATTAATAQQAMRPGEAYLTRFSGVTAGANGPAIDTAGTVGSIIDIRQPAIAPQGQHWVDEPQRQPVTAGEVGQVFGVVLDDANPPNVYLSATSAFGLHLAPGTTGWMPGQWGRGGGPGTIWRLDAADGYRPQPFATIATDGRPNGGAALGNMAFDRVGRQIFVSDLETGLIHRIDAASGNDLGSWDHGTTGRAAFLDAATGKPAALPPIAFDPAARAKIADCAAGPFERTPACWNFAPSGRRIWGVGVRRAPGEGERRLYYAVWSGPAFDQSDWTQASDEDKRNALWSVGLTRDGDFARNDVRREFLLPDFFTDPKDIARAGYSQPVSDITFAECSSKPVMLVAERGGIRNLGLGADNAFATPHEARTLRYEMDQDGVWQPVGRYDVGYDDRKSEGAPYIRANCAGGAAFGYGYTPDFATVDRSRPGDTVWITGDSLCSTNTPCRAQPPAQGQAQTAAQDDAADNSEVHGLQGMPENAVDALAPDGAYAAYPQQGEPTPATGPDQSWLIDADIDVDATGQPIDAELTRNDATRIGDVAIFAICNPPPAPIRAELLPPRPAPAAAVGIGVAAPPVIVEYPGHDRILTHATIASHGIAASHFRIASHNPWMSHDRLRSHNRWRSHDVIMSRPVHRPVGSWHRPIGSMHQPRGSLHLPQGSIHQPAGSFHRPPGSLHAPQGSAVHQPRGSIHQPQGSAVHIPQGSVGMPQHQPQGSAVHQPRGSVGLPQHQPQGSAVHQPRGSVGLPTHQPQGSVTRPPGAIGVQPGIHVPAGSAPTGIHVPAGSRPTGVHVPAGSAPSGIHVPAGSAPSGIHVPAGSVGPAIQRPPGVRGSLDNRGPARPAVTSRTHGGPKATAHRPTRPTHVTRAPARTKQVTRATTAKSSQVTRASRSTASTPPRRTQPARTPPRRPLPPR